MVTRSCQLVFVTRAVAGVAAVLLTLTTSATGAPAAPWPTLLGSRETFSAEVSAAVERVWIEPTLIRTLNARSARAPLDVYIAFVDAPEVTAAAARYRKIRNYEIRALGEDRYWGSDGDGAHGVAQVLRREPRRRVYLSQGEQASPFLGTISGSALTVLDLEPQENEVKSRLTAYVHIDDRVAASVAQLFIPTFGFVADRKLGEELRITAEVAEWAVDRSGGFCDWLAHESLPPLQRGRILAALPPCVAGLRPKGSGPIQSL